MGDDATWTRRGSPQLASEIGGAAAVYESMLTLGMLREHAGLLSARRPGLMISSFCRRFASVTYQLRSDGAAI
jgi:hypothetical protein